MQQTFQTFGDDEEKPLARATGFPEHNTNGQDYMVDFHSTAVRQHGAAHVGPAKPSGVR